MAKRKIDYKRVPKPADGLAHPYLNAKRTWNSHVGGVIASRALWQAMALLCLLVVFVAVGGVVYIGSQSKFVPYVVEVDKLGEAAAVEPASLATHFDQRIVRTTLAEFVVNARTVTPDIALQRRNIFKVYSQMRANSPAAQKMTSYLNGSPESNPFKRAEKQTVNVEILSSIPQSTATWQVDWMETERNRKGDVLGKPFRMRALIHIDPTPQAQDMDEERLRLNPLGIFITDYSWSKQF